MNDDLLSTPLKSTRWEDAANHAQKPPESA